jgi:hypothetical protein
MYLLEMNPSLLYVSPLRTLLSAFSIGLIIRKFRFGHLYEDAYLYVCVLSVKENGRKPEMLTDA